MVGKRGNMDIHRLLPPHPFPARMAPEIALRAVKNSNYAGTVLDPMCGSGTVLKAAVLSGRPAMGFDVDPLAILMSRVWTAGIDTDQVVTLGTEILAEASQLDPIACPLPWIDADPETRAFVSYWFDTPQEEELRRLAYVLHSKTGDVADAVRLAFSRLIITKERGASLARDVSHSRPHRVMDSNDFSVFEAFKTSLTKVSRRLNETGHAGTSVVRSGDARNMDSVVSESVAQVVTSPPYLNAIDYIRGHKLALVWFGYRIGELRRIRADSIGAERGLGKAMKQADRLRLIERITQSAEMPSKLLGMVDRYVRDVEQFIAEAWRVLMPGGEAVFVVGNSTVRGVYIDNARLLDLVAESCGFNLTSEEQRRLPPARRYLPPPTPKEDSALGARMRSETILHFAKPQAC